MLLSEIMCALAGAIVLLAIARIVRKQLITRRSVAGIRRYEQLVKATASKVSTLAITRLGTGTRVAHAIQLISTGFELRAADGATIAVAPGAHVDLFALAATVHADGSVELPANASLLYVPRDAKVDDAGPYQTAGAVAYTRNDTLILFTHDAVLFGMPGRMRTTSVLSLAIYAAVAGVSITFALLDGPNTGWNGAIFLLVIFGGMDQIFGGIASWGLCTRAPRA